MKYYQISGQVGKSLGRDGLESVIRLNYGQMTTIGGLLSHSDTCAFAFQNPLLYQVIIHLVWIVGILVHPYMYLTQL